MPTIPTAFISFSWDNEDHKQWVKELATQLRFDGVDVKLDQWDAVPGDQLPKFMETSIRDNEYVLIICTPSYKAKSENRTGGVGYEGDIITGDIFANQNRRKYIPVLKDGDWNNAVPIWLSSVLGIDLRDTPPATNYQDLLATLKGQRSHAPPIGQQTAAPKTAIRTLVTAPSTIKGAWEDIKIMGIILEEVTSPRNDGTRGSALYTVPFRLSRRPSSEWIEVFEHTWNRPPEFTSMHRPGIASVIGDRVILDGTHIEEVEKYHLKTLKLALKVTNQKIAEYEHAKAEQAKAEKEREQKHKDNIRDIASRLDFDDD